MKIRKTLKSSAAAVSPRTAADPPKKVQIVEESESDLYDTHTSIYCLVCDKTVENVESPQIISTVLNTTSAKQKSDIKAWEEEVTACEHTLCLQSDPVIPVRSTCSDCELSKNLWVCLVCGNVGCGRKQFDGSGGNSHGAAHFKATGHGAACKLGTITAEGTGDVYCYHCDDMRVDPYLAEHLTALGITVSSQAKSEKSMAELQLEQNLKWEFNMATEDGKKLQPVFGPGLTGLKNIGNSCYMASVLQSIATLPILRKYSDGDSHMASCRAIAPARCVQCQLEKLSGGLNSGVYSKPSMRTVADEPSFQDGISPAMFKELSCAKNEEFLSFRQQDVYEFFQFLLTFLDESDNNKPSKSFETTLCHRLECTSCNHVGYTKEVTTGISIPLSAPIDPSNEKCRVSLSQSITESAGADEIDDFKCPVCKTKVRAIRTSSYVTFPKYLVMQMRRFVLENWVPEKVNTPVSVDIQTLDLSPFRGTGKPLPGEALFPEAESPQPEVSEEHLQQLMSMGFSKNRCTRALLATNNSGPDAAMEWIFGKMDDPSLDDPVEPIANSGPVINPESISSLKDMGFTEAQARKALKQANNNTEAAIEWLFSNPGDSAEDTEEGITVDVDLHDHGPRFELHAVIAHKGTSTNCGHYVAYVKHPTEGWTLFNDEKVAKIGIIDSDTEGIDLGYLYLWRNVS